MLIFGYVKLFKSLHLSYKNNDLRVYIHLLLSAGYEKGTYKGLKLSEGQIVTSYQSIAEILNLSVSAVRVAIDHLIKADMIKWVGLPPRFSICTIINYKMQTDNNSFNYSKLYRNIRLYDWYRDDISAKIYYYILLHYGIGGCTFRPIDIQNDLCIDRKQYSKSINKLVESGAIVLTTQQNGKEVIATIAGDKVDVKGEDKVDKKIEDKVEKKTDDKVKTEKIKDKDVCVDLDDILML